MIAVERDICRSFEEATAREWIVTNGIGGYASGTVAGVNTRRYHGLLVAALAPPRQRTVVLARIDEEVVVDDRTFYLGASEYHDGTVHPNGYIHLEQCRLDDGIPTFTYEVPKVTLAKTIWLEPGQNTTYVRYAHVEGADSITLRIVLFATYRGFHQETSGAPDWVFAVREVTEGIEIQAFLEATPLRVRTSPSTRFIQTGVWYWRYLHRRERERGLDYLEDLYTPGLFVATLAPGQTLTVQASTHSWPELASDAEASLAARRERQRRQWTTSPLGEVAPDLRDLVVAADQFVVSPIGKAASGAGPGIIAGYHWFEEWGRDTLIALPGLLLVNGRFDEARRILQRYAALIDHGEIPNRLPDDEHPAEYNAVDPSLWFFQALEHYLDATRDDDLLVEIFPRLQEVIDAYTSGTRFGIGVDESDGLLAAGAPGVQLTWMDAKVGDWVITPRRGKPVEVNALWYNALRLIDDWSRRVGRNGDRYGEAARRARESFNRRFWYAEGGYLYDVVDDPASGGDDASLRPNQVFAISLIYPTLDPRRWDAVLDRVEAELLTPCGLRSLAPTAREYVGHYGGDQRRRDAAYHQGTVWPWLLGAYADACRRAGRDLTSLRRVLTQLLRGLTTYGLATLPEIFDGDPPHTPGGCISQAWSVAEVLRAWRRLIQE